MRLCGSRRSISYAPGPIRLPSPCEDGENRGSMPSRRVLDGPALDEDPVWIQWRSWRNPAAQPLGRSGKNNALIFSLALLATFWWRRLVLRCERTCNCRTGTVGSHGATIRAILCKAREALAAPGHIQTTPSQSDRPARGPERQTGNRISARCLRPVASDKSPHLRAFRVAPTTSSCFRAFLF